MILKMLSILSLAAFATAGTREIYSPRTASIDSSRDSTDVGYNFKWVVRDDDFGNGFGHEETLEGDQILEGDLIQGSYGTNLPDGRFQTVRFYVDGDSGYVAEVSYEREAQDIGYFEESYEITELK